MDKLECYSYLFKIRDEHNININEHIKQIAGKETIPYSTVKFINDYIPQQSVLTLESIYNKRHKNPLYKNLVNENAALEDKAIALSSLLTQSLIGCKNLPDIDKRTKYFESMYLSDIFSALTDYSKGNTLKLESVFNKIRSEIKSFSEGVRKDEE